MASSPVPFSASGRGSTCSQAVPPRKEHDGASSLQNAPPVPRPKLRLQFEDLTHAGTRIFLENIPDPHGVINQATSDIVAYIYTSPTCSPGGNCPVTFEPSLPTTESVTLILREFSGVAYTVGSLAGSQHKEIHFSLTYIAGRTHLEDIAPELIGVITHELVHCYQHTRPHRSPDIPRPPSGLIEGVADFVRLKAGLVPSHWRRPLNSDDLPERWDVGYQQTAFFFEWLENSRVGTGAIGMLNDRLLREGYVDGFWVNLFGVDVLELWMAYGQHLDQANPEAVRN